VTGYKKKIFVLLAVVALCNGRIVVCRAESATTAAKKPLFDNSSSLFASDPNFTEESGGSVDTRELFFKMMFSVLVVVVLGVTTIYIIKKFLPRITNLPGKAIRIIETAHLGPRKTVHLLKVGNQRLLIGSTSENITMLADVTDALSETDLSGQQPDSIGY